MKPQELLAMRNKLRYQLETAKQTFDKEIRTLRKKFSSVSERQEAKTILQEIVRRTDEFKAIMAKITKSAKIL